MAKDKAQFNCDKFELATHFIINHPECIPLLKDKWVTDEILSICLEEEPSIFRFIKHPSLALIKKALELDGANIQYIPKRERKDLPIGLFMSAINSNPRVAINYIPKKYITEDMKRQLFEEDPQLIKDNQLDMLQSEFLKSQIEENPSNIKFINDPSDELKCAALRKDPNIALYFDELTPKMMDVIDELYPAIKDSLPNYRR